MVYFDDVVLGKASAADPYHDCAVYLDEDPFVIDYHHWPLFLKLGCPLIEAGAGYIDEFPYLVGKASCRYFVPDTNSLRGIPDTNVVNIGFHYFDWDYGFGVLKSDLYRDGIVNFNDFAFLAAGWLTAYDMNDLIDMADQWMEIVEPNIQINISGDPCNLNGDIGISVSGYDATTVRAFVFMDGDFVGEIVDFDSEGCAGLETSKYDNGQHTIKVVTVDTDGLITSSENTTVNFANELYYVRKEGSFKEGKDYPLYAMYSSGYNLRVKVVDWNETVVWTSPIIQGDINVVIPESAFSSQLYDLVIEEDNGGSWVSICSSGVGKAYEPNTSYKFAIFLPSVWDPISGNSADTRKKTVAEIKSVCETKHMPWVELYKKDCTWEKFKSVLSSPAISYVYIVTHGGTKYYGGSPGNEIYITHFRLTDSKVISYGYSYLEESGNIHYMRSLGLGTTNQIRIVQIDACSQSAHDDMAAEWIEDLFNQNNQLFVSWGSGMLFNDDWDIWSRDIWRWLGNGVTYYKARVEHAELNIENKTRYFISGVVLNYGWDQVTFTSEGN